MDSGRKIRHNNKFFDEFKNAPNQLFLYENLDIGYLKKLKNDESLTVDHKKCIVNYILKSNKQYPVKIEYFKDKSGYKIKKNGIENLEKPLKQKIYDQSGYISLDIVNCGYTLIYEIAKVNGILLPQINYFNSNREKVYHDHYHIFGSKAKAGFIDLYLNPTYTQNQTLFMQKLVEELQFVTRIFKHPRYPNFELKNVVEIYVTKIMFIVAEYLTTHGIIADKCFSLEGDKILFKPLKPFNVQKIEEHIHFETNFKIKFH